MIIIGTRRYYDWEKVGVGLYYNISVLGYLSNEGFYDWQIS